MHNAHRKEVIRIAPHSFRHGNGTVWVIVILVAIGAVAWLFTLTGNDTNTITTTNTAANANADSAIASRTSVTFTFSNLSPLSQGHYEGWIIVDGSPVSTGTFNINDSGDIISLAGTTVSSGTFDTGVDLSTATRAVITVEPDGDTDTIPSDTKILGADLDGTNTGTLTFDVIDLSGASGQFILGTPTDGQNTNETAGIWFVTPDGKTASLDVPDAPPGWDYEGWAVCTDKGDPISTGRFFSADGPDIFNGYSGTQPAPAFPGEDFLINASTGWTFPPNLANGSCTVILSIEPSDGGVDFTGDDPFQLKPFSAPVEEGLEDHVLADLNLDLTGFPTGTITIN